jgi:hypothetical protein
MKNFKPRKKGRPEAKIQDAIIKKLRYLEWLVKPTHGNAYQSGFPDLFAAHVKYGQRWIEVKNAAAYSFTPAQIEWFPQFSAAQCGIWILVSDSDEEIKKLMAPPNWHTYMKGIWDI